MALVPLATQDNFLHIYDFYVDGSPEEFVKIFNEFDYGDNNPMHKSPAQVKDGVLVQDVKDPQHFWLIAEWSDIEEHARIRKILANELKPAFIKHIRGSGFVPQYAKVVSSTPQHLLDSAHAKG
ncbi:MAG: hypothetical protein AB7O31_13040 [Burkholderiales bacterium]